MPPKKVVKCFECPEDIRVKILSELYMLFQNNVIELLSPYNKLIICSGLFTESYLVSNQLMSAITKLWSAGRNMYCAGIYLGRLRRFKPYLIPSTMLANAVFSKLGSYVNSVVLSESGLKPFLYGRDVLKASVIKTYPKIRSGNYVFVLGSDGYAYGVGLAEVGDEEFNRLGELDVVVRNVFDVGWYLRGGTEPRERKFKNIKRHA